MYEVHRYRIEDNLGTLTPAIWSLSGAESCIHLHGAVAATKKATTRSRPNPIGIVSLHNSVLLVNASADLLCCPARPSTPANCALHR